MDRQTMRPNFRAITWCIISCVVSCIFALSWPAAYAVPFELRIPKPQYENSIAHSYYTQLLHKVLLKGANGREMPAFKATIQLEQGRAIRELQEGGLIDVYWLGTDVVREKNLRAIRIPLDRGLLGYRKFIIHRNSLHAFEAIDSLSALKKMRACQGLSWPDTKILRAAGLYVMETPGFENILQQVSAKRCDYFPRGIIEIDVELLQHQQTYPMLMSFESLILYYPLSVYFFVSPNNKILAQWLESGLEKMIDDGELQHFLEHHPLTATVFPFSINENSRSITIANPFLPSDTDYKNPRYWIQPEELLGKEINSNK